MQARNCDVGGVYFVLNVLNVSVHGANHESKGCGTSRAELRFYRIIYLWLCHTLDHMTRDDISVLCRSTSALCRRRSKKCRQIPTDTAGNICADSDM